MIGCGVEFKGSVEMEREEDEFQAIYTKRLPVLQRARQRLNEILTRVAAKIEDKTLVRAEVQPVRIKPLESIRAKAKKNLWGDTEAFEHCSDLIGGRVVCNNIADVYRYFELVSDALPNYVRMQDHIITPNAQGYRALHIDFTIDVGEFPVSLEMIPCEVQIRTRLQDAWAELAHDDIYKQSDLPEDLRARSKDLAEVLAAAEKIVSDIRERVARTVIPERYPDLSVVSAEGLAFAYSDVFGEPIPDYVVQQGLNICGLLSITSLEKLPTVLASYDFRERLANKYRKILFGLRIPRHELFFACLRALAKGEKAAMNYVRRRARGERDEIDSIAKREMLACLPNDVEELVKQLETGEADIEGWADALEATHECHPWCSTKIVDPYALAEAVSDHYNVGDPDGELCEAILKVVYASSVETGGWPNSSLCSFHADQAAKDD